MANYKALLLVAVVLLAATAVIVGELSKPIVSEGATKIADVARNPQDFANKTIILEGTLRLEGNYWGSGNRLFYLEDTNGNRIETLPWKPLEVYRPPNCTTCNTPAAMINYLNKKLAVSGSLLEMPNDYYDAVAGSWIANGTKYAFSVSDARILG